MKKKKIGGKLKRRDALREIGLHGRVILKRTLKEQFV
jgi:hypothetical protein